MTSSNRKDKQQRLPIPALDPVLDFLRLLWSIDHSLRRTSKRMELSRGITGPQRLVIRIVGRFPGITAGQLAEILHVHPSTLTGILKKLHGRRLITRRPDLRDRRREFLGLTPAGREHDLNTEETIESAVQRVISEIPRARLAASRQALELLARILQERF
jgi:DNA-binding MarR family transcriptional regulator